MKHRIIVKPIAGLEQREFRKSIGRFGGRAENSINELNAHVVEFDSLSSSESLVAALNNHSQIKFAEVDQLVSGSLIPNDPSFASQWALTKIGAPTAWDTSTGSNVTIAILDTGVESSHPDLSANIVPGYNFYDNNTNTADAQHHGTNVAGVAAAAFNNTIGIAGTAPTAKIMPVRIADANVYAYWSTVAQGAMWAADQGARVAVCSYVGLSGSSTIIDAGLYFQSQGGMFVGPGGNSGSLDSNAFNDAYVIVGPTDQNDVVASFATYGPGIHITAPGVSMLTTDTGGGYRTVSGTSFSAPTVGGVLAMMISVLPSITPAQMHSILRSTAVKLGNSALGHDNYYGYGRVDAAAAVAAAVAGAPPADPTPPTVSITSPVSGDVAGVIIVAVEANDNVSVTRVELLINDILFAFDQSPPYNFIWNTATHGQGAVTLTARAYDAAGNIATSIDRNVNVNNNTDVLAPTVVIVTPANNSTIAGIVNVVATAIDDTEITSLSISVNGIIKSANTDINKLTYKLNAKSLPKGSHIITATATDSSGNVKNASITVTK